MSQNKKFNGFGYLLNKVYENSPENIKQFFFQEKIDIKEREKLVNNIHRSLFSSDSK